MFTRLLLSFFFFSFEIIIYIERSSQPFTFTVVSTLGRTRAPANLAEKSRTARWTR
ncbi:hypothetical protein PUN28_018630 [Cardiocondyla obscurior]|uniref:Uncharacterized protein n=1 Tax=Cardiocondyla obscurior TaxID=286306 RepID=A0AAW2EFQ9_9HYME